MSSATLSVSSVEPLVLPAHTRNRPWLSVQTIVISDVAGLAVSFGTSTLIWSAFRGRLVTPPGLDYLIAVALFLGIFAGADLYQTTGVEAVTEIRRAVIAITWTFLLLVLATFLWKESTNSRGWIILAWLCAAVIIPATRLIIKPILGKLPWFAKPVAILGGGRTALDLIDTLRRNPGLALRPVVAFDDRPAECEMLSGVPVLRGIDSASSYCRSLGIDYAIIALPEISRERFLEVIRCTRGSFSKLLLLPDLLGVSSVWVTARDVGGTLGLEIRDNLLQRSSLVAKRLLDLALIISAAPLLLPVCGVIAILVKLRSPGPAFYAQPRMGLRGVMIPVWKFRTMLENADELLEHFLTQNPDLQEEWLKDHKLKNDPRINSLGRFLRRTSLDELPQLWNVLKSEMSLVGPRPIVSAEIEKFGDSYQAYTRVPPGITGPWQISGRNRLSYEERVRLNERYVRNWSVWLDLFILFKTIRVVLTADGAY